MEFFRSARLQNFGPLFLAEIAGIRTIRRILATDLPSEATSWMGGGPFRRFWKHSQRRAAAPVAVAAPVETVPLPPNLHWGLLVLILVLTRNISQRAFPALNWAGPCAAKRARQLSGNNQGPGAGG